MVLLQNNIDEFKVARLQQLQLNHLQFIGFALKFSLPVTLFEELRFTTITFHEFHFLHLFLHELLLLLFLQLLVLTIFFEFLLLL
jgi:hypothetical protein